MRYFTLNWKVKESLILPVRVSKERRDILPGFRSEPPQEDSQGCRTAPRPFPRSSSHIRNCCSAKRRGRENSVQHAGPTMTRALPSALTRMPPARCRKARRRRWGASWSRFCEYAGAPKKRENPSFPVALFSPTESKSTSQFAACFLTHPTHEKTPQISQPAGFH